MPVNESSDRRRSGRSLYRQSIASLMWVVVALIGLLPLLTLVKIGSVLWQRSPHAQGLYSVQSILLLSFSGVSVVCGLYLLRHIVQRVRELSRISQQLNAHARRAGPLSAATDTVQDELSAEPSTRALRPLVASDQNELDSLTLALEQLRTSVGETVSRLELQASYLEKIEGVLQDCSDMLLLLNERNDVTFCNRMAVQKLGLVPDRGVRRSLSEGKLGVSEWEPLATMLEEWRDRDEELSFAAPSSSLLAVNVRVMVVRPQSAARHKVVILHDVSERKRFERQLYRSERLALLGQLISGVAHELNNPLAAVLGFAELSRDPRLTQSELTHNLEVIDREARRTAHIVQDLLDFSRQKTSVRVPSDVHELLERCFALLAYNFRANNITVVREYGRDLPLVVLDQYQMQQVFMNLIINAAQAMLQAQTPQPRLTVTSRRDATGGLTVEIADNGPGIPQSHLTRIFEPFFSTKQDQGTGLGLPISQGIVQQHNGSLTVTSREGEGARFRVSLPLTELVLAPEPLPPQPEPVSRPEPPRVEVFEGRVLVVDDELSVLDMAKQALSQTGLDVVTATTVKEAIEQLKATTFSLVITDVRMPDGDGTKIWEFVRAQQPRLTGHLIFVTGDPQVASRICSRLGVEVPTILKPFHVEDLCAKVRERLCPPQPRSNSAAVPRA